MRLRTPSFLGFVIGAVVLLTGLALACTNVPQPSDGRVSPPTDTTVVAGGLQFYFFGIKGHSYSLDAVAADNALPAGWVNTCCSCPTSDMAGVTNTLGTDPADPSGAHVRKSFTATANTYYAFDVSNSTKAIVSISETSLFSPQWTTFSGYITSWSFSNTTSAPIHGTLTLNDFSSGSQVAQVPVNSATGGVADNGILPGKTAFLYTYSAGINIAANMAGSAMFTHDGPPGAILAGSFTQSPGGILLPVKFEPIRQIR